MNKRLKHLKPHDTFSLILPPIFILLTALARAWWIVGIELAVIVIYYIFRFFSRRRFNEQLFSYLDSMADLLEKTSRENLTSFPMPITLLDDSGNLLWYNDLFHDILQKNKVPSLFGEHISKLCDSIYLDQVAGGRQRFDVGYLGKYYTVYAMRQGTKGSEHFYALYWMEDDTLKRENIRLKAEKPCICYIMIDSYDEIPSDVSEIEKSNFVTRVDVKIRNLARSVDGILKKLETDKYLLIFEKRKLQVLENNKFSILEEVKNISIGERVHATLSVGVARMTGELRKIDHAARAALDMALSRGGDQAAVNTGEKYVFYGGKAQAPEKRKRVKVRIIAEAFATQVTTADRVIIMGHKYADLDCIGAALGLAHCVNILATPVSIVIHPKENLVGNLIETVSTIPEYSDVFVDAARAQKLMTENTLLIIVDTHSLTYMESEKLYKSASRVALIDHHRKVTTAAVENPLINFHEPNASSCCEMVAELVDNLPGCRIGKPEANAMMAGIILDTKNFTERTGVRTFEAAAYLKSAGADTAQVQKFFKSDIDTYKRQLEIMGSAKLYGDNMVAPYAAENVPAIKMLAGKAADELLGLKGVHASYVLYREDGQTHISARGEGDKNVGTVMEALGGGGHRGAAGVQLECGIEEATEALLKEITEIERS